METTTATNYPETFQVGRFTYITELRTARNGEQCIAIRLAGTCKDTVSFDINTRSFSRLIAFDVDAYAADPEYGDFDIDAFYSRIESSFLAAKQALTNTEPRTESVASDRAITATVASGWTSPENAERIGIAYVTPDTRQTKVCLSCSNTFTKSEVQKRGGDWNSGPYCECGC